MKRNKRKCQDNGFIQIPGITGYFIDQNGNVYSEFIGRCLKPSLRGGYKFVQLQMDDGKIHNWLIHRLMALTFIPNPQNLPEIDHIDGDRFNNKIDNLRWVTKKQNQNNPISKEKRTFAIRQKQGIPVKAFFEGKEIGEYSCLMEAAKDLQLHCTLISKQVRGKIDNVKGYIFERI